MRIQISNKYYIYLIFTAYFLIEATPYTWARSQLY
jgi:hypothetical protein